MLLSRGRIAWRAVNIIRQSGDRLPAVRNSHHFNYRDQGPPPSKIVEYGAIACQGYAWWWVLWHVVTEPEHLFGEFDYPDPSKWTDEELGIPPAE